MSEHIGCMAPGCPNNGKTMFCLFGLEGSDIKACSPECLDRLSPPKLRTIPRQFQIGDVVQLKSGGPPMTVYRSGVLGKAEWLLCEWFDGGSRHEHTFQVACLKPYEPPSKEYLKACRKCGKLGCGCNWVSPENAAKLEAVDALTTQPSQPPCSACDGDGSRMIQMAVTSMVSCGGYRWRDGNGTSYRDKEGREIGLKTIGGPCTVCGGSKVAPVRAMWRGEPLPASSIWWSPAPMPVPKGFKSLEEFTLDVVMRNPLKATEPENAAQN